jgi:hypothetical protein
VLTLTEFGSITLPLDRDRLVYVCIAGRKRTASI